MSAYMSENPSMQYLLLRRLQMLHVYRNKRKSKIILKCMVSTQVSEFEIKYILTNIKCHALSRVVTTIEDMHLFFLGICGV